MLLGQIMRLISNGDRETFRNEVEKIQDSDDHATLINNAASKNQVWAIEELIRVGAYLNAEVGPFKANGITSAASVNALDAAKVLLANGARIQTTSASQSPIIVAVGKGNLDFLKWLVDSGGDPHHIFRLNDGGLRNAYSFAMECGKTEIVDYLKQLGARLPVDDENVPADTKAKISAQQNEPTSGIVAHVQAQLGPVNPLSAQEIFAPLGEASVTVNFVEPTNDHPYRTLFSTGPSSLALPIPDGSEGYEFAEFVLHLPAEWPDPVTSDAKWQWPISYFKQVAYMPHLKQKWIGPGSIIAALDIEPEWSESSDLTHVMLTPGLVEPLTGDRTVHFYTIIPMTSQAQLLGIDGGPSRIVAAVKSGELDITAAWRPFL